jgi:hypothetical protein
MGLQSPIGGCHFDKATFITVVLGSGMLAVGGRRGKVILGGVPDAAGADRQMDQTLLAGTDVGGVF